jgi:hypothetical protein
MADHTAHVDKKTMDQIWGKYKIDLKKAFDPVIILDLDDWRGVEAYIRLKCEWRKQDAKK